MITPRFDKYRKARTVQFLNDVLDILSDEDANTLNITKKHQKLKATIDNLNQIWKNTKRSKLTSNLKDLDEKRGSIYRGFKVTIETWSRNHFDEKKKAMAQEIMTTISSYNSRITELPYQEETAGLKSLVQNINKLHSSKIKQLQMQEWLVNLEQINSKFEELYIVRTQELSIHNDGEINTVRQEAISDFRLLMNVFEARYTIAQEEEAETVVLFKKISDHLSQLAEQHNLAAARTRDNQKSNYNMDEEDESAKIEEGVDSTPADTDEQKAAADEDDNKENNSDL